ncbi:MAG: archaellin/type IV pilin N-terminal domain-containing protein [Nitrososphaerales archaeon]
MNNRTLRMKHSKKAVTPVIATIILIAATIVLALVVGAYTFGLFGSNVKTVTLSSATLYAGNEWVAPSVPGTNNGTATAVNGISYITFSLNNPGSVTSISSVTLTGSGISSVSVWNVWVPTAPDDFYSVSYTSTGKYNQMSAGAVTPFTFYAVGGQAITTGQIYNYVLNFQNGQSVSGSLYAQ